MLFTVGRVGVLILLDPQEFTLAITKRLNPVT
jgi:hypothetical protein